jgi:D-threo-aldose 1-dehydrogenase
VKRSLLGRTAVAVTELGFGGAPVGNLYSAIDDDTARLALDAAWDGGVRYFDTAPHYGLGLSERRIGAALRARPRDQFAVSTKVGRLLVANPTPTGSDLAAGGFDTPDNLRRELDYSRDGVVRSIEASLERLQLDHLDIVFVHDPEDHMEIALRESVPALLELRAQGIVGAVGVGMNFVAPLRRFVAEADIDVVLVAGRWTLVDQSAAVLLDDCVEHGVAVIAAAAFNSGLLAQLDPSADDRFEYGPVPPDVLDVARTCAQVCRRHGTTLPIAALQFPLRHPAVRSVLVGMRTPEDCAEDVAALGADLDERLWQELPRAAR